MTHDLIVRPEAEAELAEAYAWYEARTQGLGDDFLLSIDAAFHAIVRNHKHYPVILKTARRALLHRFPYAVFVVADDNHITVLAVFHAKRDPQRWKQRR